MPDKPTPDTPPVIHPCGGPGQPPCPPVPAAEPIPAVAPKESKWKEFEESIGNAIGEAKFGE